MHQVGGLLNKGKLDILDSVTHAATIMSATRLSKMFKLKALERAFPYFVTSCFIIIVGIAVLLTRCYKNETINFSLFVATAALALIAYIQLKALRQQATADFLLRFNREFFDKSTNQGIIIAIEEKKSILRENRGMFTVYQLDGFLGYYELMSHYVARGLMDFEFIDEMFGHYISLAWQNEEIKRYIDELRSETKDPRYYKPFEDLALKIMEKEKEVREQ